MPLLEILLLLAVAAAGLLAGRLLRAPAIVAYLVAGVLVGPGFLGWASRTHGLEQIAELGVALLLFGVGIEFSLERLRRGLARVLLSGGLQVCATIAVTALGFGLAGLSWPVAIFTGFLVSLSSTAIVFKLYDESGEIDAPQGQAAAGILLFQDLALVPMVLLVPVLADPGPGDTVAALRVLGEASVALMLLLVLARVILPRVLQLVARAGTPELFPVAALVIAFGTALGATLLGLSLPVGAFLAGLAVSGSPFAQQVFVELMPLRDAFVAIFFTSVGMLVEPAMLLADPGAFLGLTLAVVVKGVLVGVIVGLIWRSARLAVLTGLGLAQIGEFSVVLLDEGITSGLIDASAEQAFLGATILTMGATPFLMQLARRLAAVERAGEAEPEGQLRDHVLLLGYGETGRAIARVLRETGIPFAALDLIADEVEQGRGEGVPLHFGDATRRARLQELGAERMRAAVVALGDPLGTRRAVSALRQLNPRARILVRARHVVEIPELERLGADEVLPSEFETSIELFVRLLRHLGVPRHVARVQESLLRLDQYGALRGVGATPELLAQAEAVLTGGILETAQVMEDCEAAGRTLEEIGLRIRTGAQILNVVRGEAPLPSPGPDTRLEPGDLVVLYGPHEAIDRALRLLEPPSENGPGSLPP